MAKPTSVVFLETLVLVNADFSQRAEVTPAQYQWVPSPQGGVERVMLDRLGGERARATSFVRYAPGSIFPSHQHPGGEEILVLSGRFCDDDSGYPAGWYLRNPPGSAHQPSSPEGAIIFVKLWQMAPTEKNHIRIDTRDPANWWYEAGREVCQLFSNDSERTSLQRLAPGTSVFDGPVAGAELVIVEGSIVEADCRYESGSWIRLPNGTDARISAGAQGATIYLKTGHLAEAVEGA